MNIQDLDSFDLTKTKEQSKKNEKDFKQPTGFFKGISSLVDFFILLPFRVILSIIFSLIYLKDYNSDLANTFDNKIPEPMEFLSFMISRGYAQSILVIMCLILLLTSSYYILCFYITGRTFGMKLMRIKIVDTRNEEICLTKCVLQYWLSIVPILLPIAIFTSYIFIGPGFIFFGQIVFYLFWLQFSSFRKRKQVFHEYILGTLIVKDDRKKS